EIEREDAAVKEADDARQRPNPAERCSREAHRLGPGQLNDGGAQQLGQELRNLAAGAANDGEIEDALAGVALLAFGERGDAGGFKESLDRRLRRADTGAALFLGDVLLGERQPGDDQ